MPRPRLLTDGNSFGVTCDTGDNELAYVYWDDPADGACLFLCEYCAPKGSRVIDWMYEYMGEGDL